MREEVLNGGVQEDFFSLESENAVKPWTRRRVRQHINPDSDIADSVEMDLQLRPHENGEGHYDSESQVNSKFNTSSFYTSILSYMFHLNGEAVYDYSVKLELPSGKREFRPDLYYKDMFDNSHFFEVKSYLHRSSSPICRVAQVEDYLWALVDRRMEEDEPSADFAFFSYGDREKLSLGQMSEEETVKKLAHSTNHVLIMPLNLVLFTLLMQRIQSFERDDDAQKYWRLSGNMLTQLKNVNSFNLYDIARHHSEHLKDYAKRKGKHHYRVPMIERALEKSIKALDTNLFGLDGLVVERKMSDQKANLSYQGVAVSPFEFVTYRIKNYRQTLDRICEKHEEISSLLGIRNVYSEWVREHLPW